MASWMLIWAGARQGKNVPSSLEGLLWVSWVGCGEGLWPFLLTKSSNLGWVGSWWPRLGVG